jgi:hypothetical protein
MLNMITFVVLGLFCALVIALMVTQMVKGNAAVFIVVFLAACFGFVGVWAIRDRMETRTATSLTQAASQLAGAEQAYYRAHGTYSTGVVADLASRNPQFRSLLNSNVTVTELLLGPDKQTIRSQVTGGRGQFRHQQDMLLSHGQRIR